STTTERGARFLTTARSGTPPLWTSAGRLIATVTGAGSRHGAGRGLTTRRGASRHFTMVAGLSSADAGAGVQVPFMRGLSMGRRLSVSSAAALVLDSASASAEES